MPKRSGLVSPSPSSYLEYLQRKCNAAERNAADYPGTNGGDENTYDDLDGGQGTESEAESTKPPSNCSRRTRQQRSDGQGTESRSDPDLDGIALYNPFAAGQSIFMPAPNGRLCK